jgi:S-adenosylmethionine:tRNA-ribosyltransferase-isomerase (queuine synthetase)
MPFLLDYPLENFRTVLNTNLIAPFLLIKKTLSAPIDRQINQVTHSRFDRLGEFLRSGDLLVFNSSRTLPAALDGCKAPVKPCMQVRLAGHLPDDSWRALLMCQQGDPFAFR